MRSFFILAAWRTGSTLFTTILGVHPRIVTLFETRWFANLSWYLKRLQRLPDSRRVDSMFEFLKNSEHLEQFSTSSEKLREIVTKRQESPDSILPALMAELARQTKPSADYWGEKSGLHSFYIREIDSVFPDTKFIYLVRDPRATVNSISKPSFVDCSNDWCVAAHCYVRFNQAIERGLGRIPSERQLMVYYEDLVRYPRKELQRCCDFLEIEFDPVMLTHERFKRNLGGIGSEKAAHVVTREFVNEWKKALTATQVRCIELFTYGLQSVSYYERSHSKSSRFSYSFSLVILEIKHLCLRLTEILVEMLRGRPFVWSKLKIHLRALLSKISHLWS